jgi:hypothetical protein
MSVGLVYQHNRIFVPVKVGKHKQRLMRPVYPSLAPSCIMPYTGPMAQQKYGVSPWGKWFAEALEAYGMDARLDRGKRLCGKTDTSGLADNSTQDICRSHRKGISLF